MARAIRPGEPGLLSQYGTVRATARPGARRRIDIPCIDIHEQLTDINVSQIDGSVTVNVSTS